MHDDIRAERDRLLQRGREEGVVDDRARAGRMRGFDREAQVGDAQQRIGRRFDPHQRGLALQRRGQRARIRKIGEHEFEMALARECIEQTPTAAVRVVRGDQHVARLQVRVEHERDRRHARGRDHGTRAAFEFGERVGEQVARGIAAARVVVAAFVVEAGEAEVRREHQRRHDGAVGFIAVDARTHRDGTGMHDAHAQASSQQPSARANTCAIASGSLRNPSCP